MEANTAHHQHLSFPSPSIVIGITSLDIIINNNTHRFHQRKSGCGDLECVQGADEQMGGHC